VLRSSVENFVKALGVTRHKDILKIKNLYEVFDLASEVPFFANEVGAPWFGKLKQIYAELCADVHTATSLNMEHISALGYFPHFDEKKAADFERLFGRVAVAYLSVLVLMFRETYFSMHFRNRDIVDEVLPVAMRRSLHEA
jgi:hypothetical protein